MYTCVTRVERNSRSADFARVRWKKTVDPVFFIPRCFHKQYARVEQSPISKWLLNEAWLAEFSASPISRPLSYLPSQSREDFQSGVDRGPELIQKWINSNTDSQPFPTTVLKKNCFKKFNEKSNWFIESLKSHRSIFHSRS